MMCVAPAVRGFNYYMHRTTPPSHCLLSFRDLLIEPVHVALAAVTLGDDTPPVARAAPGASTGQSSGTFVAPQPAGVRNVNSGVSVAALAVRSVAPL
eukprot:2212330-Amphidinium_carterae.1